MFATYEFLAQLMEDMLQHHLSKSDRQSGQNRGQTETKQEGDYAISLSVIILSQALRGRASISTTVDSLHAPAMPLLRASHLEDYSCACLLSPPPI
jgi:hypothetical protein